MTLISVHKLLELRIVHTKTQLSEQSHDILRISQEEDFIWVALRTHLEALESSKYFLGSYYGLGCHFSQHTALEKEPDTVSKEKICGRCHQDEIEKLLRIFKVAPQEKRT